jgi:hypothetical protein
MGSHSPLLHLSFPPVLAHISKKMSRSIVNTKTYPWLFNASETISTKANGDTKDIEVKIPKCRGKTPSLQASRLRGMMLEAHADPAKILAFVCSYDALSSKLCEEAGFPALFLAGYPMASSLALPDTGYIAFQEVVGKVQETARATSVPILVDGDTGYGGPMNVRRTVEG